MTQSDLPLKPLGQSGGNSLGVGFPAEWLGGLSPVAGRGVGEEAASLSP